MAVSKNPDGMWVADDNNSHSIPHFMEPFVRYLNIYDPIFAAARSKSEFYFLSTLFAIRGLEDAGWNPYETTLRALKTMVKLHSETKGEAQRHIELWLYGHITEASEPYELIGNLLGVAVGEPYLTERFPAQIGKNGKSHPMSHGEKANEIERLAKLANFPDAAVPLREMRDRELRNAIFHSDYTLYGPEVRIRSPFKIYTREQISIIANRSLAYLEAISSLQKVHLTAYQQPKVIETPSEFSQSPTVVLVAKGKGAVGLQAALSKEDVASGHILWRMALLTPNQRAALESNPYEWLLPGEYQAD